MAKFFEPGKRKKRLLTALSALLTLTLSIGVVSACGAAKTPEEEEEETTPSKVDTQLLKNGNFEFYSESEEDENDEKRALINSATDWTFNSGSPSSNTSSGIINVADWDYIFKPGSYNPLGDIDRATAIESLKDTSATRPELPSSVASAAAEHWDEVNAYDRLLFYAYYNITSADQFEKYGDYRYNVAFKDVQYLDPELTGALRLHDDAAQTEKEETSVLMIHNRRTDSNVRGTAQYYTSGTTITLQPGTAAEISAWVKTAALYHYTAGADDATSVPVTKRAGAYIGVTNTVGGNTLDQMQIKNIITNGKIDGNETNGWAKYTVYVRANSFSTTTFRVVLGLGQGTSDQRYEAVDGYAFFDDVAVKRITEAEYEAAVGDDGTGNNKVTQVCGLDSTADEKKFYATTPEAGTFNTDTAYALDLDKKGSYENLPLTDPSDGNFFEIGLTRENAGSETVYTSASIDPSLGDNRTGSLEPDASRRSIAEYTTFTALGERAKPATADYNGYLQNIYEELSRRPASFGDNLFLLLSTNGAAYTATLTPKEFTLAPETRLLLSFYVKTSEIRSGKMGAGATLIDGENKNAIASFDSNSVAVVDIDSTSDNEEYKDIYKGWVKCTFFVQNDSKEETKSFRLKLTYGPTEISTATKDSFSDGYAAFANFRFTYLTKAQYGYASTGDYVKTTTLTSVVKDPSKFSDGAATGPAFETGLAYPVNYKGVQAGSYYVTDTERDENGEVLNSNPSNAELAANGVYTGLLSSDYAKNYMTQTENEDTMPAWKTFLNGKAGNPATPEDWWTKLFGTAKLGAANPAYQPLVMLNTNASTDRPSYGFFGPTATVTSGSASKISVRVKLSANATAYLYLTDVSDTETKFQTRLTPTLPFATYWYDDDGNIVARDPSSDEYDEETDVLFTREENGLYKKVGDESGDLYANLENYELDNATNDLTTKSGVVAYHYNKADGNYYAYYDEDAEEGKQYTQKVLPLKGAVEAEKMRYSYTSEQLTAHEAVIAVKGSDVSDWVEVSFYVAAGNEDKTYRLELWAGERTNKTDGFKADSYIFFDACSTETVSDFSSAIGARADRIKTHINTLANKKPGEEGYLGEDDLLPAEYNGKALALYYTFTFFDSPDYIRYDASEDEDELGNHWGSYVQSEHTEAPVWLYSEDYEGSIFRSFPSVALYLSYAENEVTVTPDDLGGDDDNHNDSGSDSNSSNGLDTTNAFLLFSSIALVAALVFALIMMIVVRPMLKRRKKTVKVKEKRSHRKPLKKETPAAGDEEEEETDSPEPAPAPAPDENDPYNE